MDRPEKDELEQIATWFNEEGLAPESSKEAQLFLLWRAFQSTRSHLSNVTRDLETQRSQHFAEMAEVRKSLEQIRIFTEHKDVLAREIQDENDQLKDQMRRLISLQDSQISEVAKMLYQQGLTELIHSSPSEQVAYLLVERASFLETNVVPDKLMAEVDGNTAILPETENQMLNTNAHQSSHKVASRHGQSPWKRLFGLHKASQSKHAFIPTEVRHFPIHTSSVEKECSRLERDLEEGSRRLAMAHSEIRRLTDELESAHLTQRAYEPDLQAAKQEVDHLRQEIEKLKKYEMVELRKAKEMNNRLDHEIRALRNRVRSLDAEKKYLQQTVESLQEQVEQLESSLQVQANQANNLSKTEMERSECTLKDQQMLLTPQVQANHAHESAKTVESMHINEICRDLQTKLSAQSRCLLKKKSEIHSLKQQLDNKHEDLDNLIAIICTKENKNLDQRLRQKDADSRDWENTQCQLKENFVAENQELQTQLQPLQKKEMTPFNESPGYHEAVNTLLAYQDKCETLKMEICETLKCLDKERSKYHEMKEKHKTKLCRTKERFVNDTAWRDEKIRNLERELSVCSQSLAKGKELTVSITVENDKLLVERRRLLQQLNDEEHNKTDSNLTATLSKCRADFLEMENKNLRDRILQMSNQLTVLECSLQNTKSLQCAEAAGTELKKISTPTQVVCPHPAPSRVMMPEFSETEGVLDHTETKQKDVTSSPHCFISGPQCGPAEMIYLNLTSSQRHPDH